jgi:hypothetical protein
MAKPIFLLVFLFIDQNVHNARVSETDYYGWREIDRKEVLGVGKQDPIILNEVQSTYLKPINMQLSNTNQNARFFHHDLNRMQPGLKNSFCLLNYISIFLCLMLKSYQLEKACYFPILISKIFLKTRILQIFCVYEEQNAYMMELNENCLKCLCFVSKKIT